MEELNALLLLWDTAERDEVERWGEIEGMRIRKGGLLGGIYGLVWLCNYGTDVLVAHGVKSFKNNV